MYVYDGEDKNLHFVCFVCFVRLFFHEGKEGRIFLFGENDF